MVLRRCPDCDGAGQTPHVDVAMCAARPEVGAAGPTWVECPGCAGHGWVGGSVPLAQGADGGADTD